jgi:putative transposase
MKVLLVLLARLLTTLARLFGPGGLKTVLAENLLLKHQLLILTRSRKRAPNLTALNRFLCGFWSLFLPTRRIRRAAVLLKPSTLLRLHRALKTSKYRWLYSSQWKRKPGPKGPPPDLIRAILELKRRNPRFGCPKIAQQLTKAFGIDINKDVVRRVLAAHDRPCSQEGGPSWLTFLGHSKESLWSLDLFRAESILLKSHWVLLVMDQFTRRIVGLGVQPMVVDGPALCRRFNQIIVGQQLPLRLSFDPDPLFTYQQWAANLRILEVEPIQTVPHVPVSHPFVERLIGTVRREYLDHILFWNAIDLEKKLEDFKTYYNAYRVHQGLHGITPNEMADGRAPPQASLHGYDWHSHCKGLFELPVAA